MTAKAVYVLCAVLSLGCAWMLLRGYARTRARLLFWSGACFVCIAASNALLFVDLIVIPGTSLALLRNGVTLAGLLMLLYGMIWDTV